MDVAGYRIDRVDPTELPEAEQEAIARLWQVMGKELVPEDPVRPLQAVLTRLRAKPANQWSARVRARDAKGNVVGWMGGGKSLNEPENAHLIWSELQVRDRESWFKQVGVEWWLILAIHEATGQGAGFTEITYDPKQPWVIWQQGTAVIDPHRGHKLGLWMKAAMLDRVLRERPESKVIRTGNANTNAQMLGINTQLGFKVAWQSTLWQLPIADARKALDLAEAAPVSR